MRAVPPLKTCFAVQLENGFRVDDLRGYRRREALTGLGLVSAAAPPCAVFGEDGSDEPVPRVKLDLGCKARAEVQVPIEISESLAAPLSSGCERAPEECT
jgi:hypothetical protein